MWLYDNERALIFGTRFPTVAVLAISVCSILSSISNLLLEIHHILNVVGFVVFALGIIIIICKKTREFLHLFLLLTIFIYCPCVFVIAEGYGGSNALFAVASVFLISTLFPRNVRRKLVVLEGMLYIALCVLQVYKPEWFGSYANEQARMSAMIISLVLSFYGLSVSANAFIVRLERQNEANVALLEKYSELNKSLEELSVRDSLTGVFNRRYFDQTLETVMDDLKDNNISLLMMDLDHFKQINDTYGHGFGDWVLIETCRVIKQQLRDTDVLARYGGEEFVVVLSKTNHEEAINIANRIQKQVSLITTREKAAISISIGVAQYEKSQSIDQFIKNADDKMYEAKCAGRNRVCG